MLLTNQEVNILWLALKTDGSRNSEGIWIARLIAPEDSVDAGSIFKKIKDACLKEDNLTWKEESELELGTSEKALVLKLLARGWEFEQCATVEDLKKKLA
jgi:hypothetical protein